MNPSFFLIRTKDNRILGPVVKEDLVKRVLNGELETQDEICPASGYWVFLHEREEVKKVLGVEPPALKRIKSDSDDTTETETETATQTATDTVEVPVPIQTDRPEDMEKEFTPLPRSTPEYSVERPFFIKLLLYFFLGLLIFILARIYLLTQS